jgi:hypothetical protein
MPDERYCSNCRAELTDRADACPECGVYAGDLFDERSLRPRTRRSFVVALLVVVVIAAAVLVWLRMPVRPALPWQQKEPAPIQASPTSVRVVHDRPGGARRAVGAEINEAEAMRLLRRHLASMKSIPTACLVVMSHEPRAGDYFFTALNRCDSIRLGRWRVDGKSGAVTLAK